MTTTWRFIPAIEASGSTHMAIDEWLLDQHRLGYELPCLRFYTWQPVAISLGHHQYHYPKNWDFLSYQQQAIDIVRRPSGGRAVLHQGDLTYSLVTSGYQGRRRDIYAQLCQFLIAGCHRLGFCLHLGTDGYRYQRSDDCFGTATAADLVMDNGYKVIGSAQLYRKHCILQHGSIRLTPDPILVETVFGTRITPPAALSKVSTSAVIEALKLSAQSTFGITFKYQPLSLQEQQQAIHWARTNWA